MSARGERLRVFTGTAHPKLAQDICAHMGVPLGAASLQRFPDGEINLKVECDVRGADVFVVQPTCPPVHENLFELLSFADCLRRASADRITAVIPYYGYARKDRKDEGRVPITAKLCANLITEAGCDRVLCVDLHAAQIQGFFDIPVDHLTASPVLVEYYQQRMDELGDCVVVSPDIGNVKVANMFASVLGYDMAIIDKRRQSGSKVVIKNLIGEVKGRRVLMFDDMISTAGTVSEAAKVVMEEGATACEVACTHAVLVGQAFPRLSVPEITSVTVTDTIPGGERLKPLEGKLVVRSVAKLLGEAVHRIHHDQSVSAMFREGIGVKR
jgi:ribose-phosphate pyrophosphokinase